MALPASLETGTPPDRRRSFLRPFLLYAGASLALYFALPSDTLFRWLLEWLAAAVGAIAAAAGVDVVVQGAVVVVPDSFGIEIALECSGVPELLIFLSAVLAFPAAPGSKAVGALVALIGVMAGNVLRLAALLFVGLYAREYFDTVHSWVQGLASYVLMAVLWLGWLRYSALRNPLTGAPSTP